MEYHTTRIKRSNTDKTVNFMPVTVSDSKRLELLKEETAGEVLEFLGRRPVHTVAMTSFIMENGIESELNRGKFYGCRNAAGKLEGVALIGHLTLIEARSEAALVKFAEAARVSDVNIHLMMSNGSAIERFWKYYAGALEKPRLTCTEMLFELSFPFLIQACEWNVRPAEIGQLELIAEAHAEIAFMESGVDPLAKDREGFLRRCAKRIESGKTFVVFEEGQLIFKADIVAETDEVIYLEGIYVAPEFRGRGIGAKCLSKLSENLLDRAQNICLLSNKDFTDAHKMFAKAGFKKTDSCQTIFV